jgi:hypothetical protein
MKIIEDIKEFTVNRKKWLRGEGSDKSYLMDPISGKMCCLGFYAKQSGLSKKDIESMPSPGSVIQLLNGDEVYTNAEVICRPAKPIKWNTKLIWRGQKCNSKTCDALMDANDDEDITDEVREKNLTSLFKKIGITVKFIG